MRLDLTIEEQSRIIVISAPSATGKSTVVNALMDQYGEQITFSVSTTTREPRSNEKDGIHYYFMSNEEFLARKKDHYFVESAKVHSYYYGTSIEAVKQAVHNNRYCLLDVDVQGALNIKDAYPYSKFIFLLPPNLQVLKTRLQNRSEHTDEDINRRLNNALKELSQIYHYNHYVVNDILEQTIEKVADIVFDRVS